MYIKYDRWCGGKVLARCTKELVFDMSIYANYSHMIRWYVKGLKETKDWPGNIISERNIDELVLVEANYMFQIPPSVDIRDPMVIIEKNKIIEELLQ